MQANYIEAQQILDATNGGLDIIFQLYPDAIGSETKHNRKFKVRDDEKTASASLKQADDRNWLVTDFGGDSQPRNAIQCYMFEKGLGYVPAIRELAANYNIISQEKQAELIRSTFSERPAEPEELEGKFSWKIRESFNDMEIETIISKKVLSYVGWKKPVAPVLFPDKSQTSQENESAAYNRIKTAFQEYRWYPLESYSYTKDRRHMTFGSTDQYPIFLIDEGTHQKIYQPRHADKSRRFMYAGEKPKDFIHGLIQLNKAYEEKKKLIESEMNEDAEDEDRGADKKKKKSTDAKLPEVVLCSGGSDAINVALLGYRVIWMNSETAKLYQYQYDKIMIMVEKFYQLPDIDTTGKRAAHDLNMQYLDMYSIELPESLKKFRDARNNECKDLRDFLNHFGRKDFKLLVETAMPYRFWDKDAKYKGRGDNSYFAGWDYAFNNKYGYNFLSKNGFGRLVVNEEENEWVYVKLTDNIVQKVDAGIIQDYIHDFLEKRYFDIDLCNAMYNTTRLNDTSLARIKKVNIDFTDNTADSQFIFFENKTVEVTGTEIKYHKKGAVNRYVWIEDVLPHRIEAPKQAPFTITKDELGEYDIVIHDKNCPFLKYLVQTSRIHWRQELEVNLKDLPPAEQEAYKIANQCTIEGEKLSNEEIAEQKANLINKLFTIGYFLHRHKEGTKPWFAYAMDSKMSDDGKSHGGSGKSLLFDKALRRMLRKNYYMNGRNPKLTDDPHKYDGLTPFDKYILVEDAHEYLKLDIFYVDITGDIKVNPKGKKPYTIPFEQAGKFAFTSNYPPRDVGPSTERRIIYTVFSDYYHNKGENDDYNELRDPKTDLGLSLFSEFDYDQHNSFYNLMLYCLQFFLSTDEKIRPAMENVNKRQLMAVMGNLLDWGMIYLSDEAGRLDRFIVREEAYNDYVHFNGKSITPQAFTTKLKAFCKYFGYGFNPSIYLNKDKKIIQKTDAKSYNKQNNTWDVIEGAPKITKEMFYIQAGNDLKPAVPHDEQLPF